MARRPTTRRWAARPDDELHLMGGGAIPVVSEEAQIKAVLDGLAVQNRLGGVFSVQCERAQTEVPDERVTTFLLVTWAETPAALAQAEAETAEPEAGFKYEPEAGFKTALDSIEAEEEADAREAEALAETRPEATDDNPDGFDYASLEAEDVDEPARAGR